MAADRELSREEFLKEGFKGLLGFGRDFVASTIPSFPAPMTQLKSEIACIELTECTAYKGSGCRECFDVCPLPNIAITLVENLPQVLADGCTGCNLCVERCPTPGAMFLKPSH